MLKWLRRRRMRGESKRQLQIALARAEEALIDTHVDNVLHLLDIFAGERDDDELLEIYAEALGLPPSLAAVIETRVLASIGGWHPAEPRQRRFVDYDQ